MFFILTLLNLSVFQKQQVQKQLNLIQFLNTRMFNLFIFTFLTKSRLLFWSKPEQLIKNTKIMKHFLFSIYFLRLLIMVSIFLSYLVLHRRFFRLNSYRTISILQVVSLFLLRSYFDHKNLVAHHQFVKLFHYFFSNLLRLQQYISNSSKFQLHLLFF